MWLVHKQISKDISHTSFTPLLSVSSEGTASTSVCATASLGSLVGKDYLFLIPVSSQFRPHRNTQYFAEENMKCPGTSICVGILCQKHLHREGNAFEQMPIDHDIQEIDVWKKKFPQRMNITVCPSSILLNPWRI